MNHYLLPGAALIGLVSAGANAAPTPIGTFTTITASDTTPSPAGSTGLGPLGAVGGITVAGVPGPGSFTAPFTGTLVITVEPTVEIAAGDVYQAFVNGVSLGFTPPVPLALPGTNFSTGTFMTEVTAGTNTFNINDQILSYIGFQGPYGPPNTTVPASFSPNGVTVILSEELPSAVAEPRSLALLASALLGFGFFWRRRKRVRPAL